jgi:hypothetical protein
MKPKNILKKHAGQSSNEDPNKYIRSKRVESRMSLEEYAEFERIFMKSRHKTLAAYIRSRLTSEEVAGGEPSGYLVQALIQEVRKLTLAISKIGVNVNQIARSLNSRKDQPLSKVMLEEITKYHQELKPLQAVSSTLLKACSLVFKSKK